MNKQKSTHTKLDSLMGLLASKDGMIRQEARKSLIELGKPAVSELIRVLRSSKSYQMRWEAAKALGEIRDDRSITPLVNALEDSERDVAWLAAEALKKFDQAAWLPMLQALIKRGPNSVLLRQGVHHVLQNQKENGYDDLLKILKQDMECSSSPESTPAAVYGILARMKENAGTVSCGTSVWR